MITRLRPYVSRLLSIIAKPLAVLPADFYSFLSLGVLVLYLHASVSHQYPRALFFFGLSALLDAVDGAVARLRGEAGPRGGYVDSLVDRLCDAGYVAGFILMGLPLWPSYLLLTGSFLVSYSRARYESFAGRGMEGYGLMERGDRIIAFTVILVLMVLGRGRLASLVLSIVAALVWFTFIQRLLKGLQDLPRRLK